MGCTARVWDNGDTTDCGDAVLRHDLCAACLKREIDSLRAEKQKLTSLLLDVNRRLNHLQSQSG